MKEKVREIIEMEDLHPGIYGFCYHDFDYIFESLGNGNMKPLAKAIWKAIDENNFFKAENDNIRIIKNICRFFLVDYNLVKIYLGI